MAEIYGYPHVLDLTNRFLGQREDIHRTIETLQAEPEILDRIVWQFDNTLGTLNALTSPTSQDNLIRPEEREHFTNAIALRETGAGGLYPYITDLTLKGSRQLYRAAAEVFKFGGKTLVLDRQLDAEDITSIVMLNLYDFLIQQAGLPSMNLAFKEVLADQYPQSDLFIALKDQYSTAAGFSPQMVNLVGSLKNSDLKRTRPHRHQPDEVVIHQVTTDKPDFIEPLPTSLGLGSQAEVKSNLFNTVKDAVTELSSRHYIVYWAGGWPNSVITVEGIQILSPQHGVLHDVGGKYVGTYDRLISKSGRYGDSHMMVMHLLPSALPTQ